MVTIVFDKISVKLRFIKTRDILVLSNPIGGSEYPLIEIKLLVLKLLVHFPN